MTEIIEFKQYTFINFLQIAPACSLCDITSYVRFRSKNCLLAGVGNRGVYPPGRKIFENTPPPEDLKKYTPLGGASRRRHFFGQILEINVNLTGFSLNLVKLTLI